MARWTMSTRLTSPGVPRRPWTSEAVRRTGDVMRLLVAGPVLTCCCLSLSADAVAGETGETVGVPSAARLETMRTCAKTRSLRMRVDGEWCLVRHPRIDPAGVSFDQDDIEDALHWVGDDKARRMPPASPITWSAVDRVECRRSGIATSAWIGAMAAPAGYMAVRKTMKSHHSTDEDQNDFLLTVGLAPVGALVGTLWGASHPVHEPLWRRPAAGAN